MLTLKVSKRKEISKFLKETLCFKKSFMAYIMTETIT